MKSTTKLSGNPGPKSPQLSGQGAARRSLIATEWLSSPEPEITITVLLLALEAFVHETLSPDKLALVAGRIEDRLGKLGLHDHEVQATLERFKKWAELIRRQNPLSGMF